MEQKSCELQGNIFPNGSLTHMGDQYMQTSEGAVIRNNRVFMFVLLAFSWMLFTINSVCAQTYSITDPGTPSGVISPGGAGNSAYGINDSGHVMGLAYDQTGCKANAFLYSGVKTTIPRTFGGANSQAYRIKNSGQSHGHADTPSGQHHAFLYKGGKMIDLGTLGGANSYAYDINDSGQIVGSADTSEWPIARFSLQRTER